MPKLGQKERFFYNNRYILLAFFVPFILMIFGFISGGFFPTGENQIAVIDMFHQYFPFLNELQNKMQNIENPLYSWNGGLGTNFISMYAYYAASPLYLLLALVPSKFLMEAVTLIVAIKIGLGGMFMAIYLRGMHHRCDYGTVAFSTLYALCAYVMGYYWCLMWLDVVSLLPLCILGLERLIGRSDFKLYTITLAIMMWTNYYVGGMACIFILFYYPILYFSKKRNKGVKGCAKTTGLAIGCSLIGILISAVLLVPTFLSLQNTYYIDSSFPKDSTMYNAILDVITNLLPETTLTIREGLPNIYCGLVSVMMLVLFIFCRSISMRKKILNCGMLAFLILSFNWNKLDFIWHGLHFPNQLPFRYSFVFSFVLVGIAYEAFLRMQDISKRTIGMMVIGGSAYIVVAQKLYEGEFDDSFVYINLVLLFVYGAIFLVYKMGKIKETLMGMLLLVMVFAEMLGNTVSAVSEVSSTSRSEYLANRNEITRLVNDVKKQDPDFYRMELYNRFTLNSPMLYGYPGVSEFSSTVNGKVSYLMDRLGLEGENVKNRYNYVMTTPLINSMLNVKYLIGKGMPMTDENRLFELIDGAGVSTLYKNKYSLSVGFMIDTSVNAWDYNNSNPFAVQNGFAQTAAAVEEVLFLPLAAPKISATNASTGNYQNGFISCSPVNKNDSSTVQLVYQSQKDQQVYLYVDSDSARAISAQKQNGRTITLQEDCNGAVSLGRCKAGEKITVTLEYDADQAKDITAFAYEMNDAVWEKTYWKLSDEMLNVTDYSETKITGDIRVNSNGYFLTSIPYEKGWTVKVDGKKTEVEPLADALVMIPLSKGTHTIQLTYMPDGLMAGVVISICGIGILVSMCFLKKRHGQNKK